MKCVGVAISKVAARRAGLTNTVEVVQESKKEVAHPPTVVAKRPAWSAFSTTPVIPDEPDTEQLKEFASPSEWMALRLKRRLVGKSLSATQEAGSAAGR